MRLNIEKFTKSEIGVLVAEASDLGIRTPERSIFVDGFPAVGSSTVFNLYQVDTDASHEDIYGWRFRCGAQQLLIIND